VHATSRVASDDGVCSTGASTREALPKSCSRYAADDHRSHRRPSQKLQPCRRSRHRRAGTMAKTVLALALGSAAAFSPSGAPRATTVVRSDPNIKTDVGSGWKPESGGFSSTDTPDFFYEDDDERVPTQRPISSTGHRRDSCPSHDAVAGFFSDFEAVQYSRSQPHRVISTTRSASPTASWVVPV